MCEQRKKAEEGGVNKGAGGVNKGAGSVNKVRAV